MTRQTRNRCVSMCSRIYKVQIALLIGLTPLLGTVRGNDSTTASLKVSTPRNANDLKKLQGQVQKVLGDVLPAVVAVGKASGVIIRGDGLILSQYHVSHRGEYDDRKGLVVDRKPGDHVDVVLHDGRRVQAELRGGDRELDLSLLRILEPGPYPFLPLADDVPVSLGEWVLKLGHPRGFDEGRGTASRLGRVIYHNRVNIIPDCATAGGDSGGPLVNLDGQVVAISQNSDILEPLLLKRSTCRASIHMAYITVSKIREKMPTMLDGRVPRQTGFPEIDEKRKLYKEIVATLPQPLWTPGEETTAAWREMAAAARGCVVEILGEQDRTAYGTVVGPEGWILTKASEIGDNPRCRISNGDIVQAKITGVDAAFDLAMLKIDAPDLRSVQWTSRKTLPVGTLIASPDIAGRPIAAGIVASRSYPSNGPFPKAVEQAPGYEKPPAVPPEVLGTPVKGEGIAVSFSCGTAAKAGIAPGDLILEIDGRPMRKLTEIHDVMTGKVPGDILRILLARDQQPIETTLTLERYFYSNMNFRSKGFPIVFEHDVLLTHDECGGPVVDLNGKALGITIAHIGHGCVAIPSDAIQPLIEGLKNKGYERKH